MAKMSQTLKEILQIVVFFIIVGVLLTAFVIYPLNRTKAIMGRVGIDDFNPDSLSLNDPQPFTEAGLVVDTFWVEADGLTKIACVYLPPNIDSTDSIRGTVFLLHDEREDRTSAILLATVLTNSGFAVVTYDQRATGLSSAKYHGDGQYEASDLEELIAHLQIRERAVKPITVVGKSIGAEAALLASHEEERINRVIAIKPYLTTTRMIDTYRSEHDTYWLPFFRSVFWWWYNIRSGYAAEYRTIDDIRGVTIPTLVLTEQELLQAPEILRLVELSEPDMLTLMPLPGDSSDLTETIVDFIQLQGEQGVSKPAVSDDQ